MAYLPFEAGSSAPFSDLASQPFYWLTSHAQTILAPKTNHPLIVSHFYHAVSRSGVPRIATSGSTWIREYRGDHYSNHHFILHPILLRSFSIRDILNENALVSVDDRSQASSGLDQPPPTSTIHVRARGWSYRVAINEPWSLSHPTT